MPYNQTPYTRSYYIPEIDRGGDSFTNFFKSTPGSAIRHARYEPWQQNAFQNILGQAMGTIQQRPNIENMVQGITRKYQNEIIPTISSRLSQINLGNSGAMERLMGQAQGNYMSELGRLGYEDQWKQQEQAMGLLGKGLTEQSDLQLQKGSPSQFQQVIPYLVSLAGAFFGAPNLGGMGMQGGQGTQGIIDALQKLFQNSNTNQSGSSGTSEEEAVAKLMQLIKGMTSRSMGGAQ